MGLISKTHMSKMKERAWTANKSLVRKIKRLPWIWPCVGTHQKRPRPLLRDKKSCKTTWSPQSMSRKMAPGLRIKGAVVHRKAKCNSGRTGHWIRARSGTRVERANRPRARQKPVMKTSAWARRLKKKNLEDGNKRSWESAKISFKKGTGKSNMK